MIGIDMKMPRNCINCPLEHWGGESAVCTPLRRRIFTHRSISRLPNCPLHPLDNKIRVGDEVYNNIVGFNGIVTFVWPDGDVDVVAENGRATTWGEENVSRTNRYFDEIATLLNKMRGEDDG